MPGFNEISPTSLMRLIGTPDCPVILDVRLPEDLAEDPVVVPTSTCLSHDAIDALTLESPGRPIVVVCQRGKKLSHGAAAVFRSRGAQTEVLEGGIKAWISEAFPAVPLKVVTALPNTWVTRHRPKIDRIACPWLITRFVNPTARFLFVPPSEVAAQT